MSSVKAGGGGTAALPIRLWAEEHAAAVCHGRCFVLDAPASGLAVVLDGDGVAALVAEGRPPTLEEAAAALGLPASEGGQCTTSTPAASDTARELRMVIIVRPEAASAATHVQYFVHARGAGVAAVTRDVARAHLLRVRRVDVNRFVARTVVDAVRTYYEKQVREPSVRGFLSIIEKQFPKQSLYLFELLQNAVDDGARRVQFAIQRDSLVVRHDGRRFGPLDVVGLASVGLSTKAGRTLGFMGVGFKAVYRRFALVHIRDDTFAFRFEEPDTGEPSPFAANAGDSYRNRQQRDRHRDHRGGRGRHDGGRSASAGPRKTASSGWVMLPHWESPSSELESDVTCEFVMTRARGGVEAVRRDMAWLPDSVPPLLARTALRRKAARTDAPADWRLVWGDLVVTVSSDGSGGVQTGAAHARVTTETVTVSSRRGGGAEETVKWVFLTKSYAPGGPAREAYALHTKKRLPEDSSHMEEVALFFRLDESGSPLAEEGVVHSVLPTKLALPFAAHVQANWLLSVDRTDLQAVDENAWNSEIVHRLPDLLLRLLRWIAEVRPPRLRAAYSMLPTFTREGGAPSDTGSGGGNRARGGAGAGGSGSGSGHSVGNKSKRGGRRGGDSRSGRRDGGSDRATLSRDGTTPQLTLPIPSLGKHIKLSMSRLDDALDDEAVVPTFVPRSSETANQGGCSTAGSHRLRFVKSREVVAVPSPLLCHIAPRLVVDWLGASPFACPAVGDHCSSPLWERLPHLVAKRDRHESRNVALDDHSPNLCRALRTVCDTQGQEGFVSVVVRLLAGVWDTLEMNGAASPGAPSRGARQVPASAAARLLPRCDIPLEKWPVFPVVDSDSAETRCAPSSCVTVLDMCCPEEEFYSLPSTVRARLEPFITEKAVVAAESGTARHAKHGRGQRRGRDSRARPGPQFRVIPRFSPVVDELLSGDAAGRVDQPTTIDAAALQSAKKMVAAARAACKYVLTVDKLVEKYLQSVASAGPRDPRATWLRDGRLINGEDATAVVELSEWALKTGHLSVLSHVLVTNGADGSTDELCLARPHDAYVSTQLSSSGVPPSLLTACSTPLPVVSTRYLVAASGGAATPSAPHVTSSVKRRWLHALTKVGCHEGIAVLPRTSALSSTDTKEYPAVSKVPQRKKQKLVPLPYGCGVLDRSRPIVIDADLDPHWRRVLQGLGGAHRQHLSDSTAGAQRCAACAFVALVAAADYDSALVVDAVSTPEAADTLSGTEVDASQGRKAGSPRPVSVKIPTRRRAYQLSAGQAGAVCTDLGDASWIRALASERWIPAKGHTSLARPAEVYLGDDAPPAELAHLQLPDLPRDVVVSLRRSDLAKCIPFGTAAPPPPSQRLMELAARSSRGDPPSFQEWEEFWRSVATAYESGELERGERSRIKSLAHRHPTLPVTPRGFVTLPSLSAAPPPVSTQPVVELRRSSDVIFPGAEAGRVDVVPDPSTRAGAHALLLHHTAMLGVVVDASSSRWPLRLVAGGLAQLLDLPKKLSRDHVTRTLQVVWGTPAAVADTNSIVTLNLCLHALLCPLLRSTEAVAARGRDDTRLAHDSRDRSRSRDRERGRQSERARSPTSTRSRSPARSAARRSSDSLGDTSLAASENATNDALQRAGKRLVAECPDLRLLCGAGPGSLASAWRRPACAVQGKAQPSSAPQGRKIKLRRPNQVSAERAAEPATDTATTSESLRPVDAGASEGAAKRPETEPVPLVNDCPVKAPYLTEELGYQYLATLPDRTPPQYASGVFSALKKMEARVIAALRVHRLSSKQFAVDIMAAGPREEQEDLARRLGLVIGLLFGLRVEDPATSKSEIAVVSRHASMLMKVRAPAVSDARADAVTLESAVWAARVAQMPEERGAVASSESSYTTAAVEQSPTSSSRRRLHFVLCGEPEDYTLQLTREVKAVRAADVRAALEGAAPGSLGVGLTGLKFEQALSLLGYLQNPAAFDKLLLRYFVGDEQVGQYREAERRLAASRRPVGPLSAAAAPGAGRGAHRAMPAWMTNPDAARAPADGGADVGQAFPSGHHHRTGAADDSDVDSSSLPPPPPPPPYPQADVGVGGSAAPVESLVGSGAGRGRGLTLPAWMTSAGGAAGAVPGVTAATKPDESAAPVAGGGRTEDGMVNGTAGVPAAADSAAAPPAQPPASVVAQSTGGRGRGRGLTLPAWMTAGDAGVVPGISAAVDASTTTAEAGGKKAAKRPDRDESDGDSDGQANGGHASKRGRVDESTAGDGDPKNEASVVPAESAADDGAGGAAAAVQPTGAAAAGSREAEAKRALPTWRRSSQSRCIVADAEVVTGSGVVQDIVAASGGSARIVLLGGEAALATARGDLGDTQPAGSISFVAVEGRSPRGEVSASATARAFMAAVIADSDEGKGGELVVVTRDRSAAAALVNLLAARSPVSSAVVCHSAEELRAWAERQE